MRPCFFLNSPRPLTSGFHVGFSLQSLEERSENLPDPNHREQQVMQAQVVPGATQLEGETSGPNYGDVEAHRPRGTQDVLPNGVDRELRVQGQGRTLPASIGERGESGSQSAVGEAGAERVHGAAVTEGLRLASEYLRVSARSQTHKCTQSTHRHQHHQCQLSNHLQCCSSYQKGEIYLSSSKTLCQYSNSH